MTHFEHKDDVLAFSSGSCSNICHRSQRSTAGGRKGYISMPPKRNKNDFITTGDGDFSSFVQGLPIDMDNFVHVDLKGSTPLVQEVIIESQKLIIQTKVVGYVQRNTRKMYLNMLQFANK
jgi:hypothetical protein